MTIGIQPNRPEIGYGYICATKHIKLYNCHNCIVHTAEEKQVVIEGLKNYIIAEKDGALLICSSKEEQRIKKFAQ